MSLSRFRLYPCCYDHRLRTRAIEPSPQSMEYIGRCHATKQQRELHDRLWIKPTVVEMTMAEVSAMASKVLKKKTEVHIK